MKFLPYGGGNRIKLDTAGYLRVAAAAIVLMGMIVLYVFEIKHFDRVMNTWLLITYALVFGVLAGVALGRRLSRDVTEEFEKMRIYVIMIALCIVFLPLLVNLANRLLDFRTPEIKTVSLESVEPYISERFGVLKGEEVKTAGYKIVFVMDKEVIQIKSKTNPFEGYQPGDSAEVLLHRGLLGIKYVRLKNE